MRGDGEVDRQADRYGDSQPASQPASQASPTVQTTPPGQTCIHTTYKQSINQAIKKENPKKENKIIRMNAAKNEIDE